jgi:hypothetical protein
MRLIKGGAIIPKAGNPLLAKANAELSLPKAGNPLLAN